MKTLKYLGLCLLMSMAACKKDNNTEATQASASQSDQAGSAAADGAIDNVNDYVSNKIGGGSQARVAAYDLPCGVVSVDSTVNPGGNKVYIMKYGDKTPCGYTYKSGSVSFQLVKGTKFSDPGAVNAITFNNYSVQSNASNDIVTVNGTVYTTNVSGGFEWQSVLQSKTIQHRIRGGFNTTYANGAVRPRSYYQFRTWSSNNGWAGLKLDVSGDTIIDGTKVCEIGKTVDGNYDYKMQLPESFAWSNCGTDWKGPFVLKTGSASLQVTGASVSPAHVDLEAGYKYVNAQSTPAKMNDCSSNAYRITSVFGTTTKVEYQLY